MASVVCLTAIDRDLEECNVAQEIQNNQRDKLTPLIFPNQRVQVQYSLNHPVTLIQVVPST